MTNETQMAGKTATMVPLSAITNPTIGVAHDHFMVMKSTSFWGFLTNPAFGFKTQDETGLISTEEADFLNRASVRRILAFYGGRRA